MDADLSVVAGIAFDFVFSVPVVGAAVIQDASSVGVDVDSVVVCPNLAG